MRKNSFQFSVFGFRFPVFALFAGMLLFSCGQSYAPKPYAYYRIDFPEREYRLYDSDCPFAFEYPVYGTLTTFAHHVSEPCWLNIRFPRYRGTIHLTYHEIDDNFDRIMEDNWKFVYSRIAQRADAIDDFYLDRPERNIYGMIYDIKGDAASPVRFYVTDSVRHFLLGSLYFEVIPNYDSLAPAINFFRKDMIHLIETVQWKN